MSAPRYASSDRAHTYSRILALASAILAIVGGVAGLIGWLTDMPWLCDWFGTGINMKANTALSIAVAGFALLCATLLRKSRRSVISVLAIVVLVMGAATLFEHATGADLGIDNFIVEEAPGARATASPGRMGVPASTCFLLLGIGLLLSLGTSAARRWTSGMGLVIVAIAGLSLMGYLYGADQLYALPHITGISLQTALLLAVLGTGTVALIPEHGIVKDFWSPDHGGLVLRRLVLPIVIVPVVVGVLRLRGELTGLYDTAFGTAAYALFMIAALFFFIWWTASGINALSREARHAQEALRQADQRKDQFLATLAHELRNPLAPLRSGLELLNDTEQVEADNVVVRAMMKRQLDHMVHLVDDLMDVSRITRGRIQLRLETLQLSDVIAHAVETAQPVLRSAEQQFSVDLPTGPLYVVGDRTRLAQVLTNLLTNAVKYTDAGGRIHLSATASNGEVSIRLQDEGIGIPQEMLPRIFDLFAQVDHSDVRTQGGLGIGLSIVQRLVEMHGGRVTAQSAGSGTGSTFIVVLPLAPKSSNGPTAGA